MYDTIIKQVEAYTTQGIEKVDIGIKNQKIVYIGQLNSESSQTQIIRGNNLTAIPGVIDTQVHFREPGNIHKETIATGSKSAILGGVTSFMEMPNTNPSTTNQPALADKIKIANQTSYADFGFFVGATSENINQLTELYQLEGCCGIKVFLGSSTGNLLVDNYKNVEEIFQQYKGKIAFHSEFEDRLKDRSSIAEEGKDVKLHPIWRDEITAITSTKKIVELAVKYNRFIHILHITTQEEIEYLQHYKNNLTFEITPQHLTFTDEDYSQLGSRIQMNPPIRAQRHRKALWNAIDMGIVDVIGSDHAPHTLEEKAQSYPNSPSGMPGVQTILAVMLNYVNQKKLSLTKLIDLLCYNPVKIYNIKNKGRLAVGMDADITMIDMKQEYTVSDSQMASLCQWTPYDNFRFTGKVINTILRGNLVVMDSSVIAEPQGKALNYIK